LMTLEVMPLGECSGEYSPSLASIEAHNTATASKASRATFAVENGLCTGPSLL
jgi:hypothetical protein